MKLKKTVIVIALLVALTGFGSVASYGKGGEYDQIVRHLRTKYQAKKVRIPFMWLARIAVKVVRPAGVRSMNVTLFENLKFDGAEVDREMQAAMQSAFGEKWSAIFRFRSHTGEQAYMYVRESGDSAVKVAFVSVGKDQAAVVRATVDVEKLMEFMDNPKIFGVSLGDDSTKKIDSADNPSRKEEAPVVQQ